MKHTFKTKLMAILLTVVMLMTFVPVFFSFATEAAYEEEPEALKAENGNLAIGADVMTQYTPHADATWGWDYTLINDGKMNTVASENGTSNGGYHPSTSAVNQWGQNIFSINHSEWVGYEFTEAKAFDTLVVYPSQDSDGICYGMPNAFAVEVSMDGETYKRVYEVYEYAIPAFGPQTIQFEEVTAKYVRFVGLSMNNVNNTWAMKICEMAVYDTDYVPTKEAYTPNLALNKPVESTAYHSDGTVWNLTNINDGDRYNMVTGFQDYGQFCGWHTNTGVPTNEDAWIKIDLEEKTKFDKVVLWPSTEKYEHGDQGDGSYIYGIFLPTSLTVQISDDGETWTDVKTVTDMPTEYEIVEITFNAVEARYVRFYMTRTDHLKLSEFEVYDTTKTVEPEKDDNTVSIRPDVNLALDAKVIYSSITPAQGWDPAKLNNGTVVEETGGFTSGEGGPHWVGYEFDTLTYVNKLVLYSAYSDRGEDMDVWSGVPHSFKVQYSVDGITWIEVASVTNDTPPLDTDAVTVTFDSVVAKMIRIWSDDLYPKYSDLNKTYIQLQEMEAWYTPTALTAEEAFSAYIQMRDADEAGKHDLRVVLIANMKKLAEVDSVTVTISFTLKDGGTKTLTKKLAVTGSDYTLYQAVTAGDDTYTAASGFALFGNVITDIPNDAYTGVSVTIANTATSDVMFTVASK